MAREPTIHDIARLARVSIGTVSNVLNAKPTVNEELSKRVNETAAKLGYHRNSNAASLRSNQTDMIAVVVPNIENALFSEIVSAIEHRAVADRKGVMFMTTGEDQERAQRQIYSLVQRRVDGLIIVPSFDYQPLLAELEVYGIPRISDVLQRAGGLTATAYPAGVAFFRPTDHSGRIGIDLPRLLADKKFRDNLILFGGDSLFVPEYNPVVMVAGAVNSPVTVAYVPGKRLNYYVQSAGGFSQSADAGRAYVTQPSGAVKSTQRHFFLIPNSLPTPLAGAHVFVPEKVKDPNKNSSLASFAAIITSLATVLIVAIKP